MKKTIEIPEGYEARIEGNKVILGPKESEDERIRKEIINYFKCQSREEPSRKDIHNQWIAWLKKQGEQKVPINDFKAKNWYVSEVDGKIHDMTYNPADKVEPKFKVGDVIRNKWSNRTKTITAIDNSQYILDDGMPAQPLKVNINAQDNWELVEPNPAWSEEDEKILGKCIDAASGYYSPEDKQSMKDWLRAIKDRVQPKLAWCEEDDVNFHDAMWAIEQARTIAKNENDMGNLWYAERWLKSLKERYTWKPSKNQLATLWDALCDLKYNGYKNINEIVSLYNDLKKLI